MALPGHRKAGPTVMEEDKQKGPGSNRFFALWASLALLVFAILFYQSVQYVGLMNRFAEWQFALFNRYFPVLSVVGILLLLYIVWEAFRFVLRRGRRNGPAETPAMRNIATRRSASRFLGFATIIGATLFVATLIQWFQQPSSRGPATAIVLTNGQTATLRGGPVAVSGLRAIGPIARYSEDFLFLRRTRFLAPIGRGGGPEAPYNLFAEVDGMDPARDVPEHINGVLRTNALMPEVRILYLDQDIPVARNSAVIFATAGSANRPYVVLLTEILVLSLILLLFRRHLTRTANQRAQELQIKG
ncbi:MAG: hypothetical protein H2056_06290 [Sphingopyxis sp.]|nr:hypothetical protein [Sphingopyxis sp.]